MLSSNHGPHWLALTFVQIIIESTKRFALKQFMVSYTSQESTDYSFILSDTREEIFLKKIIDSIVLNEAETEISHSSYLVELSDHYPFPLPGPIIEAHSFR